jgi:capsular polysaccharide biosynthesis protein
VELKVPNWFSIVFIALVVGLTLVFSLYQTPTYEATLKMLVSQKAPEGPTITWDGGNPQDTTLTVYRVVHTESVVRAAIGQLNLPGLSAREVLANTNVEKDPGTMFINVSYQDSEPQRAQLIANTLGEMSSQKISNVTLGAYPLVAKVWKPATLPKTPVSPKPVRNTLLALALGLTICVGWAFARPRIAASVVGQTNRATMGRIDQLTTEEAAKEKELLEALGRSSSGELTAAGAALETSLTVEEAERILFRLAAKGHLLVKASETGGGLFYSFWQR